MVGMLQIITYLLAVYLVVKGLEVLQIAFASNREKRGGIIMFGVLVLVGCVVAATAFSTMQDNQAASISNSVSRLTERSPRDVSFRGQSSGYQQKPAVVYMRHILS